MHILSEFLTQVIRHETFNGQCKSLYIIIGEQRFFFSWNECFSVGAMAEFSEDTETWGKRTELSPCISNKSMCKSESKLNFFLSGLWSGVSILLGEGSEECLLRFCFVIFASILDIFQSCHSVDLVCWHYFNMTASVYKQCTDHWLSRNT